MEEMVGMEAEVMWHEAVRSTAASTPVWLFAGFCSVSTTEALRQ